MALALSPIRESIAHFGRDLGQRLHEQTRPKVSWTLRLTFAAIAAYVAAKWLYPQSDPLLAPLTALLVTQLTLFSIVRHGLDRVMSGVAGVTLAVLFSSMVGLTWWSLGLLIACSLIAGMLLRVGPNLIEVPISAMLVLGVGSHTTPAAFERIIETLIGAGVGMLLNMLLPPGVRVQSAGSGIYNFADEVSQSLERAATEMVEGVSKEQASAWLTRARNFSNLTPQVDAILNHAQESRHLNVRALTLPDTGNALRNGLDALEHSSVAVRSVFRAINDIVHFPDPDTDDAYPQRSREITSSVLNATADVIREFGNTVNARSLSATPPDITTLRTKLDHLTALRNQAREVFRNDDPNRPAVHEMNLFLVVTVGHILREFDPIGHDWMTNETPRRAKPWRRKAS